MFHGRLSILFGIEAMPAELDMRLRLAQEKVATILAGGELTLDESHLTDIIESFEHIASVLRRAKACGG